MYASVLPATSVDKAYTYALPAGVEGLAPGTYVEVPLGSRKVLGCVWDDAPDNVPPAKLKPIERVFEHVPPMAEVQRRFIDKVAAYTLSARGEVLRMALSAPKALTGKRAHKKFDDLCFAPQADKTSIQLNDEQARAAAHLCAAVEGDAYSCTLVDGVTGAGKTEVYFEAVAAALRAGKQALVLLPEIALSNAFLSRFEDRFGCAPALWHSGLGQAQRKATWKGVAQGQTKVVVGARSALFLPYKNLGLIVVDEEHEAAFKQEEGVRYNARDMAVMRAHLGGHAVALVSATPSLESFYNVRAHKYDCVRLSDRYGGAHLPEVSLIDMRATPPERGSFIAPPLKEAMAKNLAQGGQTLLFLNRRGYAPLTLCRACGHRMACAHCSAWLVEHRYTHRLSCHHCGMHQPMPEACPKCGAVDALVPIGPGVERVAEEVEALMPQARVMVLASDTTGDDGAALNQALESIRTGQVDIIVGTQILAKGHHFPGLTLVGVVDADLGLNGGDLRASERTWQLLHQVAGRAGRAQARGQVLLQSYMPENRVMESLCAHERDAFVDVELEERAIAQMPPYSRLAALIVSSTHEGRAEQCARALVLNAPQSAEVEILGPAQSGIYKLRNQYRWRLLLSAPRHLALQAYIRDMLAAVKIPSSVRVAVDIDPYSFM